MTRKQDSARKPNWKELMSEQEDFLRPLVREVLQDVLETEMDEVLGAEKGERTANRRGYRSGYYGRTPVTRVGNLELWVPQDRRGHIRTEVFERYQRSEKALVGAMTETGTSQFRAVAIVKLARRACSIENEMPAYGSGTRFYCARFDTECRFGNLWFNSAREIWGQICGRFSRGS